VKYMLLIHFDQETWGSPSLAERQKVYGEHVQLKRLVTDGPFAETREQLGGYMLIDAKDLDEAVSIAARVPGARMGTVEVRTVREGAPTAPWAAAAAAPCGPGWLFLVGDVDLEPARSTTEREEEPMCRRGPARSSGRSEG
jgi:hypothetical protein